jgi:CheY-like chemotaxis protein
MGIPTADDVAVRASAGHYRILLIDDDPDVAESLGLFLEILGHEVELASDGAAALDAARANVPDMMFVDIGLPEMDGYEVARRVRQDAAVKHVHLVALTGWSREQDKERALAAGFDCHLVKPVTPDAIRRVVARCGQPAEMSPVVGRGLYPAHY